MIPLGTPCDPETLQPLSGVTPFDPTDLTRHAVCVGMTGSGKTGLCIGLLESLAGAGVPILALDPKGDLANLALQLPDLLPEDVAPWVDPTVAARRGLTVEALAARTARRWRAGLAARGIDREAHRDWASRVEITVLTPGSEAGVPVDVVTSLTQAPDGLADDPEGLREYVTGCVSALLALVDEPADPLTDPGAILLARVLLDAFEAGEDLPFARLLPRLVDPPFERLGHFGVDQVLPREDRTALALKLNTLVASPAFAAWRQGAPLDVGAWLTPSTGRTPVRVLYLAHLPEPQRRFFVTTLLHAVVAWTRRLPGTAALRALVYFDEVFGYLPPHPKDPPSKEPVLRLMKQARAVGVGVVLATQNPVDVDYKALSNAGTWLVGRLQTPQDRRRVVHGLTQAGVAEDHLDDRIARLPARTFVWRGLEGGGVVRSLHVRALLRGPLTRAEVARLVAPYRDAWHEDPTDELLVRPLVPDGLAVRWVVEEAIARREPAGVGLLTRLTVDRDGGRLTVDWWVPDVARFPGSQEAAEAGEEDAWDHAWLAREPPEGTGAFGSIPRWLDEARDLRAWRQAVREVVRARFGVRWEAVGVVCVGVIRVR